MAYDMAPIGCQLGIPGVGPSVHPVRCPLRSHHLRRRNVGYPAMFRITRSERGDVHHVATGDKFPYVTTYTQPIHNIAIHWMYHHVWERATWRLWRRAERLARNMRRADDDLHIPFTNRQDIRCYFLGEKNRTVLTTTWPAGEPPRSG